MKYILLLLPSLVFAGEYEPEPDIYNYETTVENTYIEYKAYDNAIAAQAALSSIPSISHRTSHDSHTGWSISGSEYNGKTGLGVAIQHQADSVSFKANAASSGKEQIYGFGATFSF